MTRVVVTGHWVDGSPREPSTLAALGRVAAGAVAARPGTTTAVVPLGPGPAFVESLAAADRPWAPLTIPIHATDAREAARGARRALDAGLTPVVEGGHSIDVDAGLGFLEEFSGAQIRRRSLESDLTEAIEEGRRVLAGRDLVAAASTRRPLLGLDSVMAVGVDLGPRSAQDRELTAALTRAFSRLAPVRAPLGVIGSSDPGPGRIPGSGAGGGAAAMIRALGGRIIPTGDLLASQTRLTRELDGADLVIVLEPRLTSPDLAEAALDSATGAAAARALPVVAVGVSSTLSPHERAEWGLHGVMTTEGARPLFDIGARLARTWIASPRRGPDD
ncbi:glycerate kinase [Actinomyces sp. B33]|uniref:glycerate kinase n=1 Tax=Actinomyces sp. B33 TaxID=2942131 RepID=UPI002341E414|nr:glycerate kinase [Actinomyces sp. B33]MDC4232933.1 glycerate kinase [Actinomyces sp. B33]